MFRLVSLAIAVAVAATAPAHAQTVTASDPTSIVRALQSAGYKAKLGKDSIGDPEIESASAGSRYFINFYGCTNNRACATVTFVAGWKDTKTTMARINDWNRDKRFSRAYIDKEGDPIMEFDLDLDDGGMSQALFVDNVEFWDASVGAFKAYISN